MSGFDALAFDTNATAKMEIESYKTGATLRDKEGKAAFIELLNVDSEAAQKRRKLSRKRLFDQMQKKKKFNYTPEQQDEDDLAYLVGITKGWYLVDVNSGDSLDVPFTEDNARVLYSDPRFAWIKEQVQEFVADRANFTNT